MLVPLDVEYLGRPNVIASCLVDGGTKGIALVDPGPSSSLEGLKAALAGTGRELADVDAILLTHIHLDHAGATGTIVREHPRVQVFVHERGAPHVIDPSRLMSSAERLYGADMERLWGEMTPVPAANVHALVGGETIVAGGRRFDVAYTPGHASHHVSYFDPDTRTALVGDTVGVRVGEWPVILPPTPPPDIDLEAWSRSLAVIRAWAPERLFLTHFGPFPDPEAHLARFGEWLGNLRALADATLGDPAIEEGLRPARFAAALERLITDAAGPDAAAAYARAIPFEHCWLGMARYLARRS